MVGAYGKPVALLLASWLLFKFLRFARREKHLPPGPPTLPILGNVHLIPATNIHLKFKEWSDKYGRIFSLKIGTSTVVVLNDPRAVYELLNKRGAVFSDRPVDDQWELATKNEVLILMHPDQTWRAVKKIASQALTPKALDGNLADVFEAEISKTIFDILVKPDDFQLSVQRTSASLGSILVYGHRAPDWESFWASTVHNTVKLTAQALELGSYLPIAQFPILKLIPERWVPSRQFAQKTERNNTKVFAKARALVEERRARGDLRDSVADRFLQGAIKSDVPLTVSQVNNTLLGTLHQGASEATTSGTLTSILLLAKHPNVQEKAQTELDRICGTKRLPRWSDHNDLLYINCIVKEGLRIRPVAPNSIPYRAKEDTWYDGMLIPTGATVFLPVYALNHTYYDDAEVYNPDRYVNHRESSSAYAGADYRNRDHYAFGAGRRFCAGIQLGERTLWRMIAKILWAFKIEPAIDENGTLIKVETGADAFEGGLALRPKPFKVRFVPRSARHAEVIRQTALGVEEFLREWE